MRRRKNFDWNDAGGVFVCLGCAKPLYAKEVAYEHGADSCPECGCPCRRLDPKEIELAIARDARTAAIVAGALAFVEQKRAEGWTQRDFARGLAEMRGIIIDETP